MYYFVFSLGGGGVGKSYLIQTAAQWIDHILRKSNDNPDMPKVLLLAYTGVAAAIIGKLRFSFYNTNIIFIAIFHYRRYNFSFWSGIQIW